MVISVHWFSHVLRREDGHVLKRAFEFEVEGQTMEGRSQRSWKWPTEEKNMKVSLSREDMPCPSKWFVGINQNATNFR